MAGGSKEERAWGLSYGKRIGIPGSLFVCTLHPFPGVVQGGTRNIFGHPSSRREGYIDPCLCTRLSHIRSEAYLICTSWWCRTSPSLPPPSRVYHISYLWLHSLLHIYMYYHFFFNSTQTRRPMLVFQVDQGDPLFEFMPRYPIFWSYSHRRHSLHLFLNSRLLRNFGIILPIYNTQDTIFTSTFYHSLFKQQYTTIDNCHFTLAKHTVQ